MAEKLLMLCLKWTEMEIYRRRTRGEKTRMDIPRWAWVHVGHMKNENKINRGTTKVWQNDLMATCFLWQKLIGNGERRLQCSWWDHFNKWFSLPWPLMIIWGAISLRLLSNSVPLVALLLPPASSSSSCSNGGVTLKEGSIIFLSLFSPSSSTSCSLTSRASPSKFLRDPPVILMMVRESFSCTDGGDNDWRRGGWQGRQGVPRRRHEWRVIITLEAQSPSLLIYYVTFTVTPALTNTHISLLSCRSSLSFTMVLVAPRIHSYSHSHTLPLYGHWDCTASISHFIPDQP